MKILVQFKDPDALIDAVKEAAVASVRELPGLSDRERDGLIETRKDEAYQECCRRWFAYGEYIAVEVDTDAGTCEVVPCR